MSLAVVVIGLTLLGGVWYTLSIMLVFCIAAIEFVHLVARRGHRGFGGLMILWVLLFIVDRFAPQFSLLAPGISLLLIITLAWALIRFRQGTSNAMTGFAVTVAGGLYIGWTGAHLVSIRQLPDPDGLFWSFTLYVAVWGSDTIAYFAGRVYGHTPLIKDVSPGKTWEGYLAAVIGASTLTALSMPLWQWLGGTSALSPVHGFIIGLLISVIAPIGDFGMSMFKRYARAKDTGQLIPGHGGLLDRIDALMVAALIMYQYVVALAPKG
jgi:phosphatidate cytidylyltransferase